MLNGLSYGQATRLSRLGPRPQAGYGLSPSAGRVRSEDSPAGEVLESEELKRASESEMKTVHSYPTQLKARRLLEQRSAADLAQAAGISLSYYYIVERGLTPATKIRASASKALEAIFAIAIHELLSPCTLSDNYQLESLKDRAK